MPTIVTEANHGGGLHGRIAIELKQAFFDKVKDHLRDEGRPELAENLKYNELFALSAGTSFGALSTVGMISINGRDPYFSSPSEMGQFIDEHAEKIFPHNSNVFSKVFNNPRQLLGGFLGTTKFSNKPLREIIQDIAGKNTRMADVEDDIMLMMTKIHPDMDALFAKSHIARGEGTLIDSGDEADRKNWLLWEAALGSASPTTIFPGIELHNPARNDRVVVIDGGQSGWNNPSMPAMIETVAIYGQEVGQINMCDIVDHKVDRGLMTPHDVIHLHWGTGDFQRSVGLKDAKKNTLASVGGAIVSSAMESVHRFSLQVGQSGIRGDQFYSFDQIIKDVPEDIRPDNDFTLASKDQMLKLRDTGIYAAEQLSDQIQEAARLVGNAYIERFDYEKNNPGMSYKDYLRSEALEA